MALSSHPDMLRRLIRSVDETPLVWLWAVVAHETTIASSTFYIGRIREPLSFQPPGDPSPITFDPYPIAVGNLRTVRESAMTQMDLNVANVGGALGYWVEQGDGFLGNPAECWVVDPENLSRGPLFSAEFTIGSIVEEANTITFRMETPNYFRRDVPRDTITRDRCQRKFKSRGCGYVGSLESCNKSQERCVEIGQDELANGLIKLHPRRFLAAPGLSSE